MAVRQHSMVFVYGTLKRGGRNHSLLMRSRYLGIWQTDSLFSLYDLGEYPAVVAKGDTSIQGEVYQVNAATLQQLDRLEDYPELYDRQLIYTRFGEAWIYLMEFDRVRYRPLIRDGIWKT